MALLTGMTPDGQEVPVQVDSSGRLVAEGLTGPQGEQGPKGDQGGPGQLAGSAAAPSITPPNDPATGLYSPGADQVAISTGGSGRLFVDASGRVGVNTASPQRALHLVGSDGPVASFPTIGAKDYLVVENNGNANISIVGGATSGSSLKFFASGNNSPFSTITSDYTNGNLALVSNSSVTLSTASSERLRITSAGLVGVGTSSPLNALDVAGSISLSSGGSNVIRVLQSVNAAGYTGPGFYSQTSIGYGVTSGGTHRWIGGGDGNTELMRLTSTGLGIGTTSPNQPLEVNGTIRGGSYQFSDSGTSVASYIGFSNSNGPTAEFWGSASANAGSLLLKTAGSERARIDSSGRLLVGTTTAPDGSSAGSIAADGGLYLKSPNGSWWSLQVSDTGAVSAVAV